MGQKRILKTLGKEDLLEKNESEDTVNNNKRDLNSVEE